MEKRYKYPRTPHLPWSPGYISEDDVLLKKTNHFENKEVVVTEKLDGENTSMYRDYIHARSINYKPHASRNWIKRFHASIAHHIPYGWRLCGENIYAKHSIEYEDLESYFYLFSIWNDQNTCIDWDETLDWAKRFDFKIPREFYRGLWSYEQIAKIKVDVDRCEGYIVRTTESFSYEDFTFHVAKWVRKEHLMTDQQWLNQKVIPNRLNRR